MKRLLWLGVGLAVGGLVVRAVSKKARAYSPSGLAGAARESAGGLAASVRSFVDDVRDGMAEREREIHEAMQAGATLDELDYDELDPDERYEDEDDLDDRQGQEGIR
jgi:hypothetical protein